MLVDIFCHVDDFCKVLEKETNKKLIGSQKNAGRKPSLSMSEILTIIIYYQMSGYKNFKCYYLWHVKVHMKNDFRLVSYNRFVELMKDAILPLMFYFQVFGMGKCTGISIVDSTSIEVCNIKRERSNKVFKNLAKKGKTSVGWFFGFKIHFIINEYGEIISLFITPGNVADNDINVIDKVTENIFGKLIGDKGYLGLFERLYERGIQLIHKIRSNMKNKLMEMFDKLLLKKRGTIESVINLLKNTFNLEHSRHRSPVNFMVNIFAALFAYNLKPEKPSFEFLKALN
jgi:hypothetical protein